MRAAFQLLLPEDFLDVETIAVVEGEVFLHFFAHVEVVELYLLFLLSGLLLLFFVFVAEKMKALFFQPQRLGVLAVALTLCAKLLWLRSLPLDLGEPEVTPRFHILSIARLGGPSIRLDILRLRLLDVKVLQKLLFLWIPVLLLLL